MMHLMHPELVSTNVCGFKACHVVLTLDVFRTLRKLCSKAKKLTVKASNHEMSQGQRTPEGTFHVTVHLCWHAAMEEAASAVNTLMSQISLDTIIAGFLFV